MESTTLNVPPSPKATALLPTQTKTVYPCIPPVVCTKLLAARVCITLLFCIVQSTSFGACLTGNNNLKLQLLLYQTFTIEVGDEVDCPPAFVCTT